jgi:Restriction endonuclease
VPKRSNLHQAVIYYVKRHYAPPEVVVTESRMLYDRDSEEDREVDIVMEGSLGDEPVTISIEVKAEKRRMGAPWVESMLRKHERMPTDKLVLVSWSGFTSPALRKVENQGGRVVALTPELLPTASVQAPHYQEMTPTAEKAALLVRDDGGALLKVNDVPILLNIYAAPEHAAYLCMLRDLVQRVINEKVGEDLHRQAYENEDRDSLTHFSLEASGLEHHSWYAHDGDADRFRLISAFSVTGPIFLRRQTPEFIAMRLGETVFAMSELQMAGRSAVWVLTPSDDGTATVSWRLL